MRKVKHEIDTLDKSILFFNENSSCPSCQQNIPHTHSGSVIDELNSSKKEMNELFIQSGKEYQETEKRLTGISETESSISVMVNDISNMNSEINVIEARVVKLEESLTESVNSTQNIDTEKSALKVLVDEAILLINRKKVLVDQKGVEDVGVLLLKDGGIKTAIIREYLPLMNNLINKYLAVMDFYCDFNLDEQFNEVIKSRYRDTMTYDNFSEGEKSRIDLALLFAWREIAKLKNSANTNLLILDEILDGSLDFEGSESSFKLLESLKGISVFAISHNEGNRERFNNSIVVEKQNDFSVITYKE
jgi:DNA repair exonuclease SbcCD ATPase subunit